MAKNIAKALLDIEAVSLSPNDLFTWSSELNRLYIAIIE